MCDQGHKVTSDSQKCEIRKEGSRKLVGTTARTSNNIYVLSEIGNEKCCLERKMKVGYVIEEWVTCILITLSKSAKEKQLEKCP
jgi:hypothetical protein